MATGIMVCGLNGCGKSTLGKALAKKLGFHFIDNENLFFERTETNEPYRSPRSNDEAIELLMKEVKEHKNFVFAAVTGDYGTEILPHYNYIVEIKVPKDVRMERVRARSFMKFGDRMLKDGDLYEEEERFFSFVESRPEDHVEKWTANFSCPVICVDGTKSVEENIKYILEYMENNV